MTHEAHEEIVSACPHVRWRLMRLRPRAIGLAAIFFACIFSFFQWVLPVSPRTVLQLGNDVEFLEFSPDGSAFVTGRWRDGGKIGSRVWDTQTGGERFPLDQAGIRLETLFFSPDSRLLATRRYRKDADLNLWDARTGEEFATLRPPPYEVGRGGTVGFPFCFTPDGQFLAFDDVPSRSGGRYFTRFWNIRARRDAGRIEGYWAPQMGADSHAIVNFAYDDHDKLNRLRFWSSPADGPPRLLREVHISAPNGTLSPDHSTMASFESPPGAGKVTEITLWDLATGRKRCSFPYDEEETHIHSLSFSANSRLLVASAGWGMPGDWHTRTTFWNVASTPIQIGSFCEQSFPPTDGPPVLSADGQWLAVPQENGAKLYPTASMQEHVNLVVTDDVGPSFWGWNIKYTPSPSITFSPDSRLLAIADLWRHTRAPPLNSWIPGWIRDLVYPAHDRVVRLWETETGKQTAAFFQCRRAFYSPDGKTLATLHENGVLKLWALPLRRPLVISLALSVVSWPPPILVLHCVLGLSRRRRGA
jgi:WD40 repeat protein